MFSKIPYYTNTNSASFISSLIKTYTIIHSTVKDGSYSSRGEDRRDETHCIFHYTVRGHGEVIYKGDSFFTKEGEGFFNIINETGSGYRYPRGVHEPWEFVVLCFDGGNTREAVNELLEKKVVYGIDNVCLFGAMCNRLLQDNDSNMCITFFPRLISLLHDISASNTGIAYEFETIAKRDLLENPLISNIAREMKISREHLQREYCHQTGITPSKYMKDIRFEKLCSLLGTSLSEQEIADMMNFSSVSAMSIFFKRISGVSPQKFRKTGYCLL